MPNCEKRGTPLSQEYAHEWRICRTCRGVNDDDSPISAEANNEDYASASINRLLTQGGNPPPTQAAAPYQYAPPFNGFGYYQANLIPLLAQKMRNLGTIWFTIGIFQVFIGLACVIWGIRDYFDAAFFILPVLLLVVGISNIVGSMSDISYSDSIIDKPINITEKFCPMRPLVITMVYNLLFGGVVGVIGSIYAMTVRNFVIANWAHIANWAQFKYMEYLFENRET